MLKVFCIEWWDNAQTRYQQEYYRDLREAAERYIALERDVEQSKPEISTIHVN